MHCCSEADISSTYRVVITNCRAEEGLFLHCNLRVDSSEKPNMCDQSQGRPLQSWCARAQAARCSRLQCRFWACLLLLACIFFFLACIVVPTNITVVHPAWHFTRAQDQPILVASSNVLHARGRNVSEGNADSLRTSSGRASWRFSSRKLMVVLNAGGEVAGTPSRDKVERIGPGPGEGGEGSSCSMEDIAIVQGVMGPMPDGIPSFAVQILNLCLGVCRIADIHVSCGWFASATLVNPALFKRVGFDDCLVKDGHALAAGETLTFQYANSFQYPFSLTSATFTCP